MSEEFVMGLCMENLKSSIEDLLDLGVRKQNIEIDLHFFIKDVLRDYEPNNGDD